jgi:hypothetical protein
MESKYQNYKDLISISEFISEKRAVLKYLIEEIEFNQVNTTLRLKKTLKRITDQLFQPLVEIGEPSIVKDEILESPYTINHQLSGIPFNKFLATVKFPIRGSKNLLRYKPRYLHIDDSSSKKIYQPSSDGIFVEVKTPDLDKNHVMKEAWIQINMTKQFIIKINIEAEKWNRELIDTIAPLVIARKKELEELYK